MNQYRDGVLSIKELRSVTILLPGQNFFTGTKNFHRDKKFSPGQNLLTGAKPFHRDTIFTAEQFNMEVDNPRKRVLTLISIYKLGDVGISSNLIGPLSLTN